MKQITRPIRVLELRSVRGTGGGPEKTILTGSAMADLRRFAITVCYLRDARDPIFGIDQQAASLPIQYTEIRERHSFDPAIWPMLRRLVRAHHIDIVHSHDYKTNLLAWLTAKTDGVIALSTAHGWTGHSRREQIYYRFDKRVLARFGRVIAVSRDVQSELIRAGASRDHIAIVLNGIDPHAFRRDRSREAQMRARLGLDVEQIAIGAVGRLEPQKRFDLLIDAFSEMHRRRPNLRLIIVGDGNLRRSLERQAADRGVSAACRFVGHTTDIIGVHHALDAFVQSSDYEGTPNAVLEAMALETPIVATDAGGTRELVRDGVDGLVVPTGNRAAIVEAIGTVLENRAATAERAAAARRRVEAELSFSARMAKVEAIYEELFLSRWSPGVTAAVPA